ncbi:hypothetical protein [Rhizobium sp. MHM7A]|uniref:hypothetical protein n=1 Tax=Rhizobium sp. MHM7A TaxID=2583233 RepID=UPI0014868C24|nr:hypothetical protein [Rhizobium sp. MHM7A]
MTMTRSEIEATCKNVVEAFFRTFRRAPTEKESAMLAGAVYRYFNEPDAPSTRLQ